MIHSEDIAVCSDIFERAGVDYIEINFKYLMRDELALFDIDPIAYAKKGLDVICDTLYKSLCNTKLPILLKFSRDTFGLSSNYFLKKLDDIAKERSVGIILANTSRILLPDLMPNYQVKNSEINKVAYQTRYQSLSGMSLFPNTLSLLSTLSAHSSLPVFASGGIMSGYHAIIAMMLGASAIQVCTAFHQLKSNCINEMLTKIQSFLDNKNLDLGNIKNLISIDDPTKYNP